MRKLITFTFHTIFSMNREYGSRYSYELPDYSFAFEGRVKISVVSGSQTMFGDIRRARSEKEI